MDHQQNPMFQAGDRVQPRPGTSDGVEGPGTVTGTAPTSWRDGDHMVHVHHDNHTHTSWNSSDLDLIEPTAQPYQPEAHADGAPLPVRPTFEERLRDGLLDLAAIGEQTLAEYAEPVGALTCEPGMRVHPLSDTAGTSALRRRVVKL